MQTMLLKVESPFIVIVPAMWHQGKWGEEGVPIYSHRNCHVAPMTVGGVGDAMRPRELQAQK